MTPQQSLPSVVPGFKGGATLLHRLPTLLQHWCAHSTTTPALLV